MAGTDTRKKKLPKTTAKPATKTTGKTSPKTSAKPTKQSKSSTSKTTNKANITYDKKSNVISINPQETYQNLFNALDIESQGFITKKQIFAILLENGIQKYDPRIKDLTDHLRGFDDNQDIDEPTFQKIAAKNISILERVVKGNLVIPDFKTFTTVLEDIFNEVEQYIDGDVARYIPQLARVNPNLYAMTVCTVDGQMFMSGDHEVPYCIQSTSKPATSCMALELHGVEKVHTHVGREPSGRSFNEITLNRASLPHNPMINAGSIMCSSLIKPDAPLADRFDYVTETWRNLTGGARVGFNNSVYHSEKETADRNFALAHFMREVGAFPDDTSITDTLDLYFQMCSIEVTSSQQAIAAATFANAGVCPVTNQRVFGSENVKHCLSMMYSCGMYDFSGEYAFSVGLPAKSGVSGALMIVIPNVAGITIWSPRLDEMGNSVRGVEFSKRLVQKFNFHNYDSLVNIGKKIDPRRIQNEEHGVNVINLIWAASQGDLNEIRRLVSFGIDLNEGDYDKRTAIHLAAAEGHKHVIEYLMSKNCNLSPKDRWGTTPLADAIAHGHDDLANFIRKHGGV